MSWLLAAILPLLLDANVLVANERLNVVPMVSDDQRPDATRALGNDRIETPLRFYEAEPRVTAVPGRAGTEDVSAESLVTFPDDTVPYQGFWLAEQAAANRR